MLKGKKKVTAVLLVAAVASALIAGCGTKQDQDPQNEWEGMTKNMYKPSDSKTSDQNGNQQTAPEPAKPVTVMKDINQDRPKRSHDDGKYMFKGDLVVVGYGASDQNLSRVKVESVQSNSTVSNLNPLNFDKGGILENGAVAPTIATDMKNALLSATSHNLMNDSKLEYRMTLKYASDSYFHTDISNVEEMEECPDCVKCIQGNMKDSSFTQHDADCSTYTGYLMYFKVESSTDSTNWKDGGYLVAFKGTAKEMKHIGWVDFCRLIE